MTIKEHNGFPTYLRPLGTQETDLEGPNRLDVDNVIWEIDARWEGLEAHDELEGMLKEDAFNISGYYLNAVESVLVARIVIINVDGVNKEADPYLDDCSINIIWDLSFLPDGSVYFTPLCTEKELKMARSLGFKWSDENKLDEENAYDANHNLVDCLFLDEVLDIHPIKAGRWGLWPPHFLSDAVGVGGRPELVTAAMVVENLKELKALVDVALNVPGSVQPANMFWDDGDTEEMKKLQQLVTNMSSIVVPGDVEWPKANPDDENTSWLDLFEYVANRK